MCGEFFLKGRIDMFNVGIVKKADDRVGFFSEFFHRNSYENISVPEYGINFVVCDDGKNCSRIFYKTKVCDIVLLTNCEILENDFNVVDGNLTFFRMIPDYVRKLVKSMGKDTSVALLDKNLSTDACILLKKLCDICKNVKIVTENEKKAKTVCEDMMKNYGIVTDYFDPKSIVNSSVAVVLNDFGCRFKKGCIVIDKNKNTGNAVNDFYIPFKVRPPLGMKNVVFSEVLDLALAR